MMLHLVNLSEDLLIHITSHLDLDDLWRLRQVSVRVRAITSTAHVWKMASSRLGLPMGSSTNTNTPESLAATSGLPASLVRDTMQAVRVDRRWLTARPCEFTGYPCPDGATWIYIKLADDRWVLCTGERGDVTVMDLAQAGPSPAQKSKDGIVFESHFNPYCTWSGSVGWFRSPAIVITQLRSDFLRCFALPSVDLQESPIPNLLSQCKFSLGSISVLALEVHVSARCLMILCRDLNQETRSVYLSVWRWGPDEEHTHHPPEYIMRTAPFEAKDCEFRLIEFIGGPHVLVARTSENATHFEFYNLPSGHSRGILTAAEPRIPTAGLSLPMESHQITLPQPGSAVSGDEITVLLCVSRSARNVELIAHRISLNGPNTRLSRVGGSTFPEYFDVVDCVLGEQGVRGVASIAAPRRDSRFALALLSCGDALRVRILEHPALDLHRPMRLAFDEVRGTILFLDIEGDMNIVLFDSDLRVGLGRT